MELSPIYLDYHATTPMDEAVLGAMMPYLTTRFGNASSRSHSYGWQAAEAVDIARHQVASLLSVEDQDIFFTSGATEGINMLLKGVAESSEGRGRHIISFHTEHHAVLDVLAWLESKGFEITRLPVRPDGTIDFQLFQDAIRPATLFVTAMWANNETGVIHEMATLGRICANAGIPLLCDATQAVGKIPVSPKEMGVDMLAFSAHKLYGPKGCGAVYINPQLRIKPVALLQGGGHERGFRSGTLNVPGIVGLGMAAQLAQAAMPTEPDRIRSLRDLFEKAVLTDMEEVKVNGNVDHRLPSVTNLQVRYTDSQAVMSKFRTRLAISAGSACSSADPAPSHVLLAMGLTGMQAKGSFRITFGRQTTRDEVETAAALFKEGIRSYRAQSPVWQMHEQGIDVDDLELH